MSEPAREDAGGGGSGAVKATLAYLRPRLAEAPLTKRARRAQDYLRLGEHYIRLAEATLATGLDDRPVPRKLTWSQRLRQGLETGTFNPPNADALLADLDRARAGDHEAQERIISYLRTDGVSRGAGRRCLNRHPPTLPPNSPDHRPGLTTITGAALMQLDLPEPPAVVPGFFVEGLTLLASRPKLGKSWLMLTTAVAVATGTRALGKIQVERGECLYLGLEDNQRRLQSRLEVITDSVPAGLHLATSGAMSRLDMGGLEQLDSWLKSSSGLSPRGDRHARARPAPA